MKTRKRRSYADEKKAGGCQGLEEGRGVDRAQRIFTAMKLLCNHTVNGRYIIHVFKPMKCTTQRVNSMSTTDQSQQ